MKLRPGLPDAFFLKSSSTIFYFFFQQFLVCKESQEHKDRQSRSASGARSPQARVQPWPQTDDREQGKTKKIRAFLPQDTHTTPTSLTYWFGFNYSCLLTSSGNVQPPQKCIYIYLWLSRGWAYKLGKPGRFFLPAYGPKTPCGICYFASIGFVTFFLSSINNCFTGLGDLYLGGCISRGENWPALCQSKDEFLCRWLIILPSAYHKLTLLD